MHLPPLINDLALILIAAAVMAMLFRRLRQPAVLGYILAGFLVGPQVRWFPDVIDLESVRVWGEIGVIFLLFALGLEFSFKKLVRVGPSATLTALVEMSVMFGIGFLLGQAFGWKSMDSLFLGGILAISSTTIILQAVDELGVKTRGYVKLVFGLLIMEDLVAVLLLVILSTISMSRDFSGLQVGIVALKLIFFLALWFLLGVFLVPTLLKRMRPHLREETLLVTALGLCFLMVALSSQVGFSPALGSFVMGSILAETIESERIEHLIQPVKNLFAAVFFVSVGMLIDPALLVAYWGPIVAITLALILGKIFAIVFGSLLSGQSLRHSIQTGMSLAQIGEFSFIIAALGLSLKVTSDFLYPIAISVSAITTFTTPYLIRSSDVVVASIEKHLPTRWLRALEIFRRDSTSLTHTSSWRVLVKNSLVIIGANTVVVVAIFLLVDSFVYPWIASQISSPLWTQGSALVLAVLCSAPFLWGIALGRVGQAEGELWVGGKHRAPLLVFEATRWLFSIALVSVLSLRFVRSNAVLIAVGVVIITLAIVLSRSMGKVYELLRSHFVQNLQEKEIAKSASFVLPIAPWDSHLVGLQVNSSSPLAGKCLSDAKIRERYGVTIALIERGNRVITSPGRNEVLFPGDKLQVIGTDEQITRFKLECQPAETVDVDLSRLDYSLQAIMIDGHMPFANKTIRECGLREATQGLVVGIEKNGRRFLNPDSATVIEPGDVLWVAGNRKLLVSLREHVW
jgi:CPA2 family monovalent cation:H+ antiporter-2